MRITRILTVFVVCAALVLATLPLAAQQGAKPTVTQVFVAKPNPNQAAQFDAGLKKHMEWHKAQKDSWTYIAYQIMSGPETGSYVIVTGGHQWADFDARTPMMPADGADARMNIGPFQQSMISSFYQTMPSVSATAMDPAQSPAPLLEVIHFMAKMGKEQDFNMAMAKVHEAIQKTKWATGYTWHVLANGGDGGHYVLTLPKKKWAEMQEPPTPFPVMLQQGLGAEGAAAVMKMLDDSTASVWSELLMHRADLSYMPAK